MELKQAYDNAKDAVRTAAYTGLAAVSLGVGLLSSAGCTTTDALNVHETSKPQIVKPYEVDIMHVRHGKRDFQHYVALPLPVTQTAEINGETLNRNYLEDIILVPLDNQKHNPEGNLLRRIHINPNDEIYVLARVDKAKDENNQPIPNLSQLVTENDSSDTLTLNRKGQFDVEIGVNSARIVPKTERKLRQTTLGLNQYAKLYTREDELIDDSGNSYETLPVTLLRECTELKPELDTSTKRITYSATGHAFVPVKVDKLVSVPVVNQLQEQPQQEQEIVIPAYIEQEQEVPEASITE